MNAENDGTLFFGSPAVKIKVVQYQW